MGCLGRVVRAALGRGRGNDNAMASAADRYRRRMTAPSAIIAVQQEYTSGQLDCL